jgi:Tfp pilus assembly protein PilX
MRRRLAQEQGIALVMALGTLIVLTISTIAVITYTSSNSRTARYQGARVNAYSLAEAGINEALSVLNQPTNNPMGTGLLAARTSTYSGGEASWSGTLNQDTATWTITSTGSARNPSGASQAKKTLTVNVRISPTVTTKLANPAWNYIYSFKANDGNPSTCEMTIRNSVNLATPLYVEGDLCIQQTAQITQGPHGTTLVARGRLSLANSNQNWVGTSGAPVTSAYIGNGCALQSNPIHNPCSSADNVFASTIGTTPPNPITPPTVNWDGWYNAAAPGPKFGCVAARSSASSTWPTFDNDTTRNKSVTTAWNLTPATAYDCWTSGGELKWDPPTKTLTVNGTAFIDGSAYIDNGYVNAYSGTGTLYLTGTFLLKNAKLCALVLANGSGCDTANWDPNQKALVIAANGNADNGLPSGDSIQLVSGYFQGGVYATNNVDIDTTSNIDGPIVGNIVILGQSVGTSFPFIEFFPAGAPGNEITYAQPLPPTGYDG